MQFKIYLYVALIYIPISMGLDIKRGYEILPNNNVTFGIKVTNNTDSVVSDVQVILDYNESLFSLQNERILKLDNIPPEVHITLTLVTHTSLSSGHPALNLHRGQL
jgi:hypothetical protein